MNFCLTNAGKEYIAKVNAGKLQMHLTKAVTGTGYSSSLEILTNVLEEKQRIQIDEVSQEGEYTFIHLVLTNLEIETGYLLKQIGLFAMDEIGEEQLIIVGQSQNGDRIPPLSEKEVEYLYSIGMRVSNAAEVIFDFSINDFLRKKYFYEHLEEFEAYKKAIQEQFKALPKVKIAEKSQLDRKDTIVFELLKDSNKIVRVLERDSQDNKHEYDFASVFQTANSRENIESEESLPVLFGKIRKYFSDLKQNCYAEADNPLVLMTEATYKPPNKRTEGSLYGLITKQRGLIILTFERYIQGMENPTIPLTLYGVESTVQADAVQAENPYVGILTNLVLLEAGKETVREKEKIYGTVKSTRGEI